MSFPPEARCRGTQQRLFLSLLSWWLQVDILWLDSKGLEGPSSTPRGLWLVVEESKVQPGLLDLQTLGHVRGNGVIPEAVGHRDRHSALSLLSLPSVLATAGETEAPRGRAVPGGTWPRQVLDQHGYTREMVSPTPTP